MAEDTALVERSDQLAEVAGALRRARRGGLVVLVGGPAGAGKTSLVRAATADVARVRFGWCEPLSTARPLGAVLDLVGDGGANAVAEPGELPATLMAMLRHRPTVAVVEDLHWADGATLDVVRIVARRLHQTRSVLVCTYRDDELDPEHPTTTALGDLGRLVRPVRVDVPALSVDGVRQLCAGTDLDPRAVHHATGGNAFYVSEIVADGHDVPTSVRAAVLARLQRLDAEARRVAEVVALAPAGLSVATVLDVSATGAEAVDRAVARGVLVVDRHRLAFRHDIARVAVASTLPPGRALEGHRALLRHHLDAPWIDLTSVVHHAVHGDRPDVVVTHGREAAAQAFGRLAPQQATELLDAVLEHEAVLDATDALDVRLDLAHYLRSARRAEWAVTTAGSVVAAARDRGDVTRQARALVVRSSAFWATGSPDAARRDVEEAVELLEDGPPTDGLLDALDQAAYLAMLARRADDARSAVAAHRAAAASMGRPASLQCEEMAACADVVGGRPEEGLDRLRELVATARGRGDRVMELNLLGMLASGAGEVRSYAVARSAHAELHERAADRGLDATLDYQDAWAGRVAFEQGRWDEAVQRIDHVRHGEPHTRSTALAVLGRVRVRRGDPGARGALEDALAANTRGELQHRWPAACGLAELAWLEGRADEVAPCVEGAFEEALGTDSAWARGELGFWRWMGGVSGPLPCPAAEPFALQVAGRWRDAAAAWRSVGCPYEVGLALLDGDTAAVGEALRTFRELGARPAADVARRRLRELGVAVVAHGPRASTLANPAGLTRRQLEVLRLVARGRDNAAVAASLHLSKRTVERHVSAILVKLDVRTRAEAMVAAQDLDLAEAHPRHG